MAEVLEAISAVSGLLDFSILLVSKVRKAYERQRDLVDVLDTHALKLNDLKKLIQIVQEEDSLQTANLTGHVQRLKAVQQELQQCLKGLDPGRASTFSKTTHQLIRGSRDEKKLADIMKKVEESKQNLCISIQVAVVGLYRNLGDEIVVIAEVVRRIDETLVQLLGQGSGLRIANLLKKHPRDAQGYVILSKSEVALAVEGPSVPNEEAATGTPGEPLERSQLDRIIIRNVSRDLAIQINAPIGEDVWKGLKVQVSDNKAFGSSLQVNWQMSRDDVQRLQEDQRSKMAAEERRQDREAQERKEIRELEERKMQLEAEERKHIREMEERQRT